ncbi:hypothetical protein DRB87_14800 [Pandoraea sp. XY-2]|nr:hypothetical protein DRB87_14800 [Pandoraea sp. XY-2]
MWEIVEKNFNGFEIWINLNKHIDDIEVAIYAYVGLFREHDANYDDFQSFRPEVGVRFSDREMAIEACLATGKCMIGRRIC